jgi:hypothetical protein
VLTACCSADLFFFLKVCGGEKVDVEVRRGANVDVKVRNDEETDPEARGGKQPEASFRYVRQHNDFHFIFPRKWV